MRKTVSIKKECGGKPVKRNRKFQKLPLPDGSVVDSWIITEGSGRKKELYEVNLPFTLPNDLKVTITILPEHRISQLTGRYPLTDEMVAELPTRYNGLLLKTKLEGETVRFVKLIYHHEDVDVYVAQLKGSMEAGILDFLTESTFIIYRNKLYPPESRMTKILLYAMAHNVSPNAAVLITPEERRRKTRR
jgi:hypothetical protein